MRAAAVLERDPASRAVALARAQAPLRRTLARLAGRWLALRGWERLGFARLGDHARERLGLAARQVQELARVDAGLADLPRVEAAFLAGALSWTKARLLCRVATLADEAHWIAFARRTTARALAREVRAVDLGAIEAGALGPPALDADEDGADESPRETVTIRCTPEVRALWFHARFLAQRVAGERLAPAECMEAVVAEVLSALPLAADAADPDGALEPESGVAASAQERSRVSAVEAENTCSDSHLRLANPFSESLGAPGAATGCALSLAAATPHDTPPDTPPGSAANGCALAPPADTPDDTSSASAPLPLLDHLDDADAFETEARLRRAVAFEQRLWADMGELLAAVAAGRLFRARGFLSLEAWARERLGISPRKARALLRLERAAAACPPLRTAFRAARISWVQAHALVPLVVVPESKPWRTAWVLRAERVSVRRLEDDVERALVRRETDPAAFAATGGLPDRQTGAHPVQPESPHETPPTPPAREREQTRFFFTAPRDVARLIRAAICTVCRHLERRTGRLPTEGEAVDAMLEHAIASWLAAAPISARWRREHAVFARDGWRCTVPGCSSYRNLHDHHVVFRSAGGGDELENRATLCAWHHLRGVHEGRIRVTGRAPDRLLYELGLRTERPPLLAYTAGEEVRMG